MSAPLTTPSIMMHLVYFAQADASQGGMPDGGHGKIDTGGLSTNDEAGRQRHREGVPTGDG